MNDLNSIILEGTTKKDQRYNFVDNEQVTFCRFSVTTKRTVHSENGEKTLEEYLIPCRAVGSLAMEIGRILANTDSRDILLVGELKSDESGVYLFAEHIEYKLFKNKKSK